MLLLIGVLAITSRSSITVFFVATGGAGTGGCATTWTGVLPVSFDVGGPKLGRRRLNPKP